MPFSKEQVQPYFDRMLTGYVAKEQLEPNYTLAHDYLTGKIQELPAFTPTPVNDRFFELVNLLASPDLTPDNESLLIAFFGDKIIRPHIQYYLARTVTKPLSDSNDTVVFEKVVNTFYRLNFTGEDVFFFLFNYVPIQESDILQEVNTPVLQFMRNELVKLPASVIDAEIGAGRTVEFKSKWFVFLLLYHPEKAHQYVRNFMKVHMYYNEKMMRAILQYDFKTYGPEYIKIIDELLAQNLRSLNMAYTLYLHYNEYAPEKNTAGFLAMSEKYIQHLINDKPETYFIYEFTFTSEYYQFTGEKNIKIPLYGWALHAILINDKNRGIAVLQQMIASQIIFTKEILIILEHVLGEAAIPYLLGAAFQNAGKYENAHTRKYVFEQLKNYIGQFDIDELWQFGKYKTKKAQELAMQFLIENDATVTQKAIEAINNSKKEMRQGGARLLVMIGTPEAMVALKKSLDTETDDDTRDLIWQTCAQDVNRHITEETLRDMVEEAKKRGKLKKPVFTWLDESSLPGLFFRSGKQLNPEEVRMVLYRLAREKGMRTEPEIKPVVQLIDRELSAGFAKAVYKLFEEKNFDPKYKFLLLLAALFGNDDMVNKFCSAINKWIEDGRKNMSEYGIEALALQGSNKALRWIEYYSRKYRSKKTYVSEAALKALTIAAEELEISIHELGDRIVPDFGFEGLFKHFKVGEEEYRAFVDSNFKLAFFNEDNKKIKSVPAAASDAIKEELKSIAKEVRDVVKAQSSRLEHYLVVQRRWSFTEWQQFFLNNPIMFIYATKLLWGKYDGSNQLTDCFLCHEDTTLLDKENNEIDTPEDYRIGIVHPISLSAEELQAWKKQCFELSIDPVFPQLERPIYYLPHEASNSKEAPGVAGILTDSGSVKSTLEKYGWRRAATGDGGHIGSFHYTDRTAGIEAVLNVEGVFAYGFDDDVTLESLYFVDTTKARTNLFNDDERMIPLGKIPPILYSEVIAAIKALKVRRPQEKQ